MKTGMKAWRINEKGHPSTALRLEDIPVPQPGPGEVLVRVEAGTINFADILLCQGIYQDRPPVPFTPGLETSGVVEAVGPGVDLRIGSRVAAMSALPAGGYAEYALLRAHACLEFPDDIPATHVPLLYSTYQTSHVALFHRGRLKRGERLLVLGGAGGVGSAAIQLGAAVGAEVIAAAGSAERLEFCAAQGATHLIDYNRSDLAAELLRLTDGQGVDVVYDAVGGAHADAARRRMAWEGRYLVIGFAGGEIPNFPANHVLVKNYEVIGVHWSVYNEKGRAAVEAAHADILLLYREGLLRPPVERTVALADLPQALADLESRAVTGRLVLVP